jgi:hypothetical protein
MRFSASPSQLINNQRSGESAASGGAEVIPLLAESLSLPNSHRYLNSYAELSGGIFAWQYLRGS